MYGNIEMKAWKSPWQSIIKVTRNPGTDDMRLKFFAVYNKTYWLAR